MGCGPLLAWDRVGGHCIQCHQIPGQGIGQVQGSLWPQQWPTAGPGRLREGQAVPSLAPAICRGGVRDGFHVLTHSCLAAGMLCAQMQEEEGRSAGRRLPSQMQKVQEDAIQKGALLGLPCQGQWQS